MDVALFVYGTLRQAGVQRAILGREIGGTPDALAGYALATIPIAGHKIARATGDPSDRVEGLVLRISPAELEAADAYETDDYARIKVRLESGTDAFVYARAGEKH